MSSGVSKVVLPVDDQERAKEFWTTQVFFDCPDTEATYRELSGRGVEFPTPPRQQHFGWWSLFEDPDGTRYALGRWA